MKFIDYLSNNCHNPINSNFINDILGSYSVDEPYECCIDLDKVCIWLKCTKGSLKETILKSYIRNMDYCVVENKELGRGRKSDKILLSYSTFKLLCERSRSKNSEYIIDILPLLDSVINMYHNIYNNTKRGSFYLICADKKLNMTVDLMATIINTVENPNANNLENISSVSVYGVSNVFSVNKFIEKNKLSAMHDINPKMVIKIMNEFNITCENLIGIHGGNCREPYYYITTRSNYPERSAFAIALNIHKKLNINESSRIRGTNTEQNIILALYNIMHKILDETRLDTNPINYVLSSLTLKQDIEFFKKIYNLLDEHLITLGNLFQPVLNPNYEINRETELDIIKICICNKLLYVLPYLYANHNNPEISNIIIKFRNIKGNTNFSDTDSGLFHPNNIFNNNDVAELININELIHDIYLTCLENLHKPDILSNKKYTIKHLRILCSKYHLIVPNEATTKKDLIILLSKSSYYKYSSQQQIDKFLVL